MVEAESLPAVGLSKIKRERGSGRGGELSLSNKHLQLHVQQGKHLQ